MVCCCLMSLEWARIWFQNDDSKLVSPKQTFHKPDFYYILSLNNMDITVSFEFLVTISH